MKIEKAEVRAAALIGEIVERLNGVPPARLHVVRDMVAALAGRAVKTGRRAGRIKARKRSLIHTPFCGMWAHRADIADGRSFAGALRRAMETRGDRNDDLRRHRRAN